MNIIRNIRKGRENDPRYNSRNTGEGEHAVIIRQWFKRVIRRNGYRDDTIPLETTRFVPVLLAGQQAGLF